MAKKKTGTKKPVVKKPASKKPAAKKAAKKKSPARTPVKDLVPADLLAFLEEHDGEQFAFDRAKHPDMEVDTIVFRKPGKLRQTKFALATWEYYNNEGEKGEDPELEYDIPGIDLIADSGDGYDSEGLLIWFPSLGEFGFHDPDHCVIGLFPKTAWEAIAKKLPQYVNSQWNDSPKRKLLRPWADERCTSFKGKRR
jgi:hypothetical protein